MKYKFFDKTRVWYIIIFITIITIVAVVDLVLFWDFGIVVIVGLIFAWGLCFAGFLRTLLLLQTILIDADGLHLYTGKRKKQEIKWEDLVTIKPYYKKNQKHYMIYANDNNNPINVQFRLNNAEFEKALNQFTTANIQESDF